MNLFGMGRCFMMYTNFEKIGRAEINEVVRVDILPITKRACKFGAQDLWFLILFLFLALRSSSPCALNGTGRDVSRPGWWVKCYVFQFIIFRFLLLVLGLSFDCVIFAGHWCLPFSLFLLISTVSRDRILWVASNGGSMCFLLIACSIPELP